MIYNMIFWFRMYFWEFMEFLLFLGPEECDTIYGNGHGGYRKGGLQNEAHPWFGFVWKCCVPLNPMVNDHYPY